MRGGFFALSCRPETPVHRLQHSTTTPAALPQPSSTPAPPRPPTYASRVVNFELVTGAGQVHIALMNATTSLSTPRAVAISYNWETGEIQSINFDGDGCVALARKWVEGDGPDSARSFLVDRGWEHFWRANRAALACGALACPAAYDPQYFERHCHSSTPSPRCETDRNALTPVSTPVLPATPPIIVCH